MKIGSVGGDFAGSSDLANTLDKQDIAATQYCAVLSAPTALMLRKSSPRLSRGPSL